MKQIAKAFILKVSILGHTSLASFIYFYLVVNVIPPKNIVIPQPSWQLKQQIKPQRQHVYIFFACVNK